MRLRRLVLLLGAAAGAAAVLRHRRPRARVDVYYEDGSMVTLEPSLPQAERMLGAARHALALVRSVA